MKETHLQNLRKLHSIIPKIDPKSFTYGDLDDCLLGNAYRIFENAKKGEKRPLYLSWAKKTFGIQNSVGLLPHDSFTFLFGACWLKWQKKLSNEQQLEDARDRIAYYGKNEGVLPDDWMEEVENGRFFWMNEN